MAFNELLSDGSEETTKMYLRAIYNFFYTHVFTLSFPSILLYRYLSLNSSISPIFLEILNECVCFYGILHTICKNQQIEVIYTCLFSDHVTSWISKFNEATFREMLLPSAGNMNGYADLDGNNRTCNPGKEEVWRCG